jgi:hypothetical protein
VEHPHHQGLRVGLPLVVVEMWEAAVLAQTAALVAQAQATSSKGCDFLARGAAAGRIKLGKQPAQAAMAVFLAVAVVAARRLTTATPAARAAMVAMVG